VLACPGSGHDVALWDLDDGKQFATLTGHAGSLTALAFSPDGQRLASGSADTTVLLWSVDRPHLAHVLNELLAGRADTNRLAAFAERGVASLAEPLRQTARAESQALRLIADLGDDDYVVRDKAMRDLEKLGAEGVFPIKRALRINQDLEVQFRLKQVLARLDVKDADQLLDQPRVRKMVEVLVKLDTPQARRVLAELARVDRNTAVGEEVRSVLEQKRKGTNP
jgi:hypothetical protein